MSKAASEKLISDSHYRTNVEYERSNKKFMRAMVPAGKRLRILDVGCGTGVNARQLAEKGHDVFGIDLSDVAIEKFRANGLHGEVVDIEAGPLPLPINSFDMVYASEVIEHCVDPGAFLRKLHGVIKPGGTLLLSTPNSAFWAYRLLGVLGKVPGDYQHPGHIRFFSKRSLTLAIEDTGFEISEVSGRHMYMILGRRLGDLLAPLLRLIGFQTEPRFATGDHFWQLSGFAPKACGFWADTLIVVARKR